LKKTASEKAGCEEGKTFVAKNFRKKKLSHRKAKEKKRGKKEGGANIRKLSKLGKKGD